MSDNQPNEKAPSDRNPASGSDQLNASNTPVRKRTLKIKPSPMGLRPGLKIDSIEALIEYAEGPFHR